jgi:prepilin peptidase CpaA
MNGEELRYIIVAILLSIAVVFDLRTRKVPNAFVIFSLCVGIITQVIQTGLFGLATSIGGVVFGIMLGILFVLIKVIGAGDMKIFAAVSSLLTWKSILISFVLSFIWGALLGVVQIAVSGKLGELVTNYRFMMFKATRPAVQLHSIPFTVALFFGVLSEITLSLRGVVFL